MSEKVLLVDDDVNILAGFRRQLRKEFECEVAESGAEGLNRLARSGPFAVVVSDMRMPGMDGIAFLSEVEKWSPDSVRIMLTGNADLQTCIDAVNQGHIFRFLTKPCEPENMAQALDAGMKQYRLVTAERELIHGTLAGCIRTLADILSVVNPPAFSQGTRIRRFVRHIAATLNSKYLWEYEMAAALSQIGCVALPPDILTRITAGHSLTYKQQSILVKHPFVGCQLLSEIPRLNIVALIVGKQKNPPKECVTLHDNMSEEEIVNLGAQMLRVALDLDTLMLQGEPFIRALNTLHTKYGPDHPLVDALMSFEKGAEDRVIMQVSAEELTTNMCAAEDIQDSHGRILVTKGQRLNGPMVYYLQSCAQTQDIKEPLLVEVLTDIK